MIQPLHTVFLVTGLLLLCFRCSRADWSGLIQHALQMQPRYLRILSARIRDATRRVWGILWDTCWYLCNTGSCRSRRWKVKRGDNNGMSLMKKIDADGHWWIINMDILVWVKLLLFARKEILGICCRDSSHIYQIALQFLRMSRQRISCDKSKMSLWSFCVEVRATASKATHRFEPQ